MAYGGRLSISIIMGVFGGGSDIVSALVSTIVGIVLSISMFKVDWAKYFEKYLNK